MEAPGAISLQLGVNALCAPKLRLPLGLPTPSSDPLGGGETYLSRAWTTSPSVPVRVVASVRRLHPLRATMQRAGSMMSRLGSCLQALPSALRRSLSSAQVG